MNKLRCIENDLVPVYETDKGIKVVYGSELHKVLEVKSRFNDWIKNRFNDCDATEAEDYETFTKNLVSGGQSKEYIIKLDTAKEMAMLERNEQGKKVRKYFIEIEKKYKKVYSSESKQDLLFDALIKFAETTQKVIIEQLKDIEILKDAIREQVKVAENNARNSAKSKIDNSKYVKMNKFEENVINYGNPLFPTGPNIWYQENNWKVNSLCEVNGLTRKKMYRNIIAYLTLLHDFTWYENEYKKKYGEIPSDKVKIIEEYDALKNAAASYLNSEMNKIMLFPFR